MNTARLKALIEELLAAEEQFKIQNQLSALATAFQTFSSQPQDSGVQVEVSKKLNSLVSQVSDLEGSWELARLADLDSIRGPPILQRRDD